MAEARSLTAAERAVMHILGRVLEEPRLAWYIGPASESLALLLAAAAEIEGVERGTYVANYEPMIRTERPAPPAVPSEGVPTLVRHPTYGSLTELAQEIERTVARGEAPRMGHAGALSWFVAHLGDVQAPEHTGGTHA